MDLQELISRGRFVFAGAQERLGLYKFIDGRKTAADLARLTKRHVNNVNRDLRKLSDIGLLEEKKKDEENSLGHRTAFRHQVYDLPAYKEANQRNLHDCRSTAILSLALTVTSCAIHVKPRGLPELP